MVHQVFSSGLHGRIIRQSAGGVGCALTFNIVIVLSAKTQGSSTCFCYSSRRVFKRINFVYTTASIMRACSTKNRFTRVALCLALGTASFDAAADEASWTPRIGPLTCEQETEIELLSQDLALSEYRTVTIDGKPVPLFDAKAKFLLKNTSLAKKKPSVLLSLCSLGEGRSDPGLCRHSSFDLKIAVDGKPVTDFHIVRQGRTVFARFSIKFNAKMRREVTATFRLPEREMSREKLPETSEMQRPYKSFEYFLADSAKWKGKVGFSRVSVKMPYKATDFNTHLYAAEKPFRHKNRIAYLEKRRLDEDNAENLTFFVVSPSFEAKVKAARKKVKALPRMLKRRLKLIDLLSRYPGAASETADNLDIVFRLEQTDWDGPARKHAVLLYTRYLAEVFRFEDQGVRCDEALCIERDRIVRSIAMLCGKDASCTEAETKRFTACCDPKADNPSASDSVSGTAPASDEPRKKPSVSVSARKKPDETLLSKYFEYFVAHWPIFLAILIVMGWIGVASKSRNKTKMKELE